MNKVITREKLLNDDISRKKFTINVLLDTIETLGEKITAQEKQIVQLENNIAVAYKKGMDAGKKYFSQGAKNE